MKIYKKTGNVKRLCRSGGSIRISRNFGNIQVGADFRDGQFRYKVAVLKPGIWTIRNSPDFQGGTIRIYNSQLTNNNLFDQLDMLEPYRDGDNVTLSKNMFAKTAYPSNMMFCCFSTRNIPKFGTHGYEFDVKNIGLFSDYLASLLEENGYSVSFVANGLMSYVDNIYQDEILNSRFNLEKETDAYKLYSINKELVLGEFFTKNCMFARNNFEEEHEHRFAISFTNPLPDGMDHIDIKVTREVPSFIKFIGD